MATVNKARITAADVLVESLRVWRDGKGWVKGVEDNGAGRYCLIGGTDKAIHNLMGSKRIDGTYSSHSARMKAHGLLNKELGYDATGSLGSLICFNDHTAKSFKDVKEVVCKALGKAVKASGRAKKVVSKRGRV